MSKFRPCIDLHLGKVKQIVGSSLGADETGLQVNHVSDQSAADFAMLYAEDGLQGGHMILLGPKEVNHSPALAALKAFPNGLQVGGGITDKNAESWLNHGASHVILTSWLFDGEGVFLMERLKYLAELIGKERIVLDLSCRSLGVAGKTDERGWQVMKDHWQTATNTWVNVATLERLSEFCAEFLIHAADVEGKCQGIDVALVEYLGKYSPIPTTYAGGVRSLADLSQIQALSGGRVDVTVGSALDLFGGSLMKYKDCVSWNIHNQVRSCNRTRVNGNS